MKGNAMKLDILYEDDVMIACVKPFGVPSQQDKSNDEDMVTIVKNYIYDNSDIDEEPYVAPIHRLDRPVGGVMIFAKTREAAANLSDQLQDGEIIKYYQAILTGALPDECGELVDYIVHDTKTNTSKIAKKGDKGAKKAVLNYEVLDEFENFKEVNLFLRGMFPLVGYKSDVVYYERNERFAGESKYPLKKMLNFAWDGITSFSVKPLRFICIIGFVILFVSIAIMLYSLIMKLTGQTIAGWTFLSISIWFIGGLQMISIGIIGEYVGKMYSETKARPRFIISENLEEKK